MRVFISSPGDVPEERRIAGQVVAAMSKDPVFRDDLSLDAVLWDDPEAAATMLATRSPQDSVNESLPRPSECEVVVVILWSRMGTPLESPLKPDGTQYLSGTEWEYEDACRGAKGKARPVLVFRCTREPKVSLRDPDFAEKKHQLELVDRFFGRFDGLTGGKTGSFISYESPEAFRKQLETDLRRLLPSFKSKVGRRPSPVRHQVATRRQRRAGGLTSLVIPEAYRQWVEKEAGSLELLGLGGAQGRSLFLSSVYVPLITSGSREPERPEKSQERKSEQGSGSQSPGTPLLSILNEASLYLAGGPGAGKSTFCRWVVWLVAHGSLPPVELEPERALAETFPAALRDMLPVVVPLRDFWPSLPKKPIGSAVTAQELEDTLQRWLRERDESARDLGLVDFLNQGRTVLILDGVDEVPITDPTSSFDVSPRELFLRGLSRAAAAWTKAGNRLLVTSRPYGLSSADVGTLGLPALQVQDVPAPLQQLLARRWFRIQKQDAKRGDASANDLMRDIAERDWLQPLAGNPLMLTAMCAIYADGGKLPQDRHQLYDRIVDNVLTKRYPEPKRRARARFELCAIAHTMHTGEGLGLRHEQPLSQATFDEAELALRADRSPTTRQDSVLGPREALEDLLGRSGLVRDEGDRKLSFYHFSIQEFLAAERIFELRFEELPSAFIERWAVPGWRSTLSFLFGRYLGAFTVPTRPMRLLEGLIDGLTDAAFEPQTVAGDCAEMLLAKGHLVGDAQMSGLRRRLKGSMEARAAASERCEAGTLLGKLGDPRFDATRWFLPRDERLGFELVPSGTFLMGSNKHYPDERPLHEVDVPAFYVARFAVTVAQFVAYLSETGGPGTDLDRLGRISNHPVVNVSWHEALAYCRWLTEVLRHWRTAPPETGRWLQSTIHDGWVVMLPSEAQWEKAARGTAGAEYPWGDHFDPDRLNSAAAGIGRTSAVGAFPGGKTPYGAFDMSGNVRELTISLWGSESAVARPYPYVADDGREDLSAPDHVHRVVRGGAFTSSIVEATRAAYRLWQLADNGLPAVGFRVVVTPSARGSGPRPEAGPFDDTPK